MDSAANRSIKLYALAALLAALVLAVFFWWWFQPSLPLLAGYLTASVVGVVSVPLIYRFGGFLVDDEMVWLAERENLDHQQLLDRLGETRQELSALEVDEGVRQADMLRSLLDDYHAVVETRFIGKKRSPVEYLTAARRIQRHAVQNLHDVVAIGHSLSTIRSNASRRGDTARKDSQQSLWEEQNSRMEELLEENRNFFDALTATAVEVANIKSFNRYERIETLSRLVSLAEIARHSDR